jgi:hypothetical protein
MRQKNLISCVRVPSGAGQRLCIIISCMQRNRGLGEALDWIWDGAGTSLFCTNAHTTYLYLYLVDEGACERCEEACIYFNVTMKEVNFETSSTCYLCVCMCCIVPAERAPCRGFLRYCSAYKLGPSEGERDTDVRKLPDGPSLGYW